MPKKEFSEEYIDALATPFNRVETPEGFTEFFTAFVDPESSWSQVATWFTLIPYTQWRDTPGTRVGVAEFGRLIVGGILEELSDKKVTHFEPYEEQLNDLVGENNIPLIYASIYMAEGIHASVETPAAVNSLLSKVPDYIEKSKVDVRVKMQVLQTLNDIRKTISDLRIENQSEKKV